MLRIAEERKRTQEAELPRPAFRKVEQIQRAAETTAKKKADDDAQAKRAAEEAEHQRLAMFKAEQERKRAEEEWGRKRAEPLATTNIFLGAGREFRDCGADCPVMVVLPKGEFMMGSPGGEPGRDNGDYRGAPSDGSAWLGGDVTYRVLRGGAWHNFPADLRSAARLSLAPTTRNNIVGFRVARTL
jgi:formylglycine-generating enzyme required for sulfatase activity